MLNQIFSRKSSTWSPQYPDQAFWKFVIGRGPDIRCPVFSKTRYRNPAFRKPDIRVSGIRLSVFGTTLVWILYINSNCLPIYLNLHCKPFLRAKNEQIIHYYISPPFSAASWPSCGVFIAAVESKGLGSEILDRTHLRRRFCRRVTTDDGSCNDFMMSSTSIESSLSSFFSSFRRWLVVGRDLQY